MLLKKQTVWLLTMLSLVVVLSVYYLTAPEENAADMTATEQMEQEESKTESKTENKAETKGENKSEKETSKNTEGSSVTIASGDEFESLRMQIEDERAKLNEELTAKMGNTELSAEERDEAYAKIEQLSETKVKENIIENLIVAMDYNAALVRVDGTDVKVSVKADKQTKTEANNIIRLVRKEVSDAQNVVVDFQPEK
ncbi:SpoIIIAH-like family protein [Peribacillus frigoritolerans]|jgi:stage III sporulation protein AH|uniref:SpoIIIAH-like family protein n=1 Tax=Peribacillus TaxID=2675229 RepID=UPI00227EF925|nr:SpoIIIAH-like family protein [Peribacillus frigoritolerans]MCY9004665.1 SpoIIIAH-like family protein [Peribacillus frigoritolerans]MDP9740173.1 stage III sporulation protein AH [Bacillus sp. B2I3]MED3995240.1 SpoIIIAH-like family protein [Peribacillus frigoritolerans]MED4634947.1 SpoIIIAH-like family protein [Peribacillus frigoritolerans]